MPTKTRSKKRPSPSDGKAGWLARSDRGPHNATLPSGQPVQFIVPNSDELIRSGRLPDDLAELALFCAAHPEGADGYMADVAIQSLRAEDRAKLAKTVRDGIELADWLVAHMLLEPVVLPSEVRLLPEADVEMLLAFAERRRNVDHLGVTLPIALLEGFARFRDEPRGGADDGHGGRIDPDVRAADPDADGDQV